MKVDLDELASTIDSKLTKVRARIAELDRQQTKLQEQRAQIVSIRTMVEELLDSIAEDKEELSTPGQISEDER
jgi:hypothetical protein